MKFTPRSILATLCLPLLSAVASAQISLVTAVDLALRNSPRVHVAEDDVAHARAALEETRDVYIPTLVGGSGLGYSYGFPLGQPTLFNFQAQSLVFSYSQRDYIRGARSGLAAANFTLMDVRQAIAEETVTTYIALNHDLERQAALEQQGTFASRLVQIVGDRVQAGFDTPIDLTTSRLSDAQIRLSVLHAQDETLFDQAHLARLTGLPPDRLATIASSIPTLDGPSSTRHDAPTTATAAVPPSLAAAYANVHAKQEQAFGDSRYLFRPQISLALAYSRFSTFNNYQEYYGRRDINTGALLSFQYNAAALGIQITLPVFDAVHKARARESAADARHAEHEAEQLRDQLRDSRFRLEHTDAELATRTEIATLDQQLAEQQLDVIRLQLNTPQGDGAQITPKDEQTARIAERGKYIALLDARTQLLDARISLLRQTGELEPWLKSLAQTPAQIPTPNQPSGSNMLAPDLPPASLAHTP